MFTTKIADQILTKYKNDASNLIQILSDLQDEEKYLKMESLEAISRKLKISMSKIYGVITFYSFFRLESPAENQIYICQGTACHVKGASENAYHIKRRLGIAYGEKTKDNKFSLESVSCIGACGIAPTVIINKKTHGRQDTKSVNKLLDELGVPKK